jgi:hypothetical protein
MNAPPGLDFRAIGIGAAAGIGASLVMSVMWMLFPMNAMAGHFGIVMLASYLIGALIDIATGAIAGWLARRRGSLHGLFAGLIANIVSMGVGYALTLLRTDYGRSVEQVIAYLVAVVPWQIVGVALATIAGTIAVRLQARAGTPSA